MAMNLGMKTPKLWFANGNSDFNPTNTKYQDGFDSTGVWVGGGTAPTEEQYLDLGIVIDEREELTLGGIPISLPGTGVQSRVFWAVGGKVLRVTISGIIPDGVYIPTSTSDSDIYGSGVSTYKSNSSIFRYKLNKLLAYQDLLSGVITIHNVRYRRMGLLENTNSVPKWVVTNYSYAFISGTRNIQYTMSLDMSNNVIDGISSGIRPRAFGEIL